MKKTLLSVVAMLATSGAVMAQNGVTEVPDAEGHQYMCTAISPNGRYLGGSNSDQMGGFIYDTQSKKVVDFSAPDTDTDLQIKSISNEGVAVGWNGPAAIFNFANANCTTYGEDGQYLFMGISPDGKLIAGARYDNEDSPEGQPCLFKDGKPVDLPQPSNKFLGASSTGAAALSVSNDSIISGLWVDNMATRPALLWAPGREADTYMVYPFSRPYFAVDMESTKPYATFSCDQTVMSPNGKYIVVNVEKYTGEWESSLGVARYNTANDSLEIFTCDPEDEMFAEVGAEIMGCAVSDDGTIVGFYGGMYGPRCGFMWKKGDDKIKSLAAEFPKATLLADYDAGGFNTPAGISADGRYIAGFAYKEGETEDDGGYVSWVFDTQYDNASGVESAPAAEAKKVVARFTADGKRLKADAKARGFNMMLMKNGKTIKSFNK